MTRWWPLLLVLACAGCELADADELLFGPPVGSGVVSLPFDATQSPGCMSWDGTNIDTNPSNPACAGGGGSPAPTVTPFACGTGYAVQVVGATPGCVLLPTPDGAGAGAAATQTPWSCGAGNGARGMGGTPECFVVPTPDGSVATVTPGGGTPQPIATSTSAPGSADGFARVDHVHHIADGAIGAAKLAFTVPTPDGTPNPGDVTAVGSCTDGACLTDGKATSGSTLVVWEGSTVDGNQLTINAGSSDPAAAHILVVPDTDGILVATVDGAEQDPQVGTRTSGAYCKGDGSAVQCTTTTVELASGGTGAALTDPNADRIMFWDDSAGATAYLEPSTGLAIQGTAIVAVTPVYYATPTPVPTPGSDPALAAGQCAWANGYDGLVCEGSTANTIETHLVAANPTTSDKTITLPDATGTVALLEQSQTFTGVNTFTNDVVIGGGTQTTLQQVTVQSGYDFYFTDGSGNGAQFTAASDLFAPYGTGTVRANDVSCASAPCVTLSSEVTGTLPLANGGTGAALTDPNADRIMFWDDSAGAIDWLTPGTGLAIQGTAIVAVTPTPTVTVTPTPNAGLQGDQWLLVNDTSTGTTAHRAVKLSGAPSRAMRAATSDTYGVIGICVADCGTTGNATVQVSGLASCEFDNATTAGNYVTLSTTTAGQCHDAGATFPAAGLVLGLVLTTNGSAGTYTIGLHAKLVEDATLSRLGQLIEGTELANPLDIPAGTVVDWGMAGGALKAPGRGATATPALTATPTVSPTPTVALTATPTVTVSPTPTVTATITGTTATPTPVASLTPTPTWTVLATAAAPTATATPACPSGQTDRSLCVEQNRVLGVDTGPFPANGRVETVMTLFDQIIRGTKTFQDGIVLPTPLPVAQGGTGKAARPIGTWTWTFSDDLVGLVSTRFFGPNATYSALTNGSDDPQTSVALAEIPVTDDMTCARMRCVFTSSAAAAGVGATMSLCRNGACWSGWLGCDLAMAGTGADETLTAAATGAGARFRAGDTIAVRVGLRDARNPGFVRVRGMVSCDYD